MPQPNVTNMVLSLVRKFDNNEIDDKELRAKAAAFGKEEEEWSL